MDPIPTSTFTIKHVFHRGKVYVLKEVSNKPAHEFT